jgi:hypothetical protein
LDSGQGWKGQILKVSDHLLMGCKTVSRLTLIFSLEGTDVGPSGEDFALGPQ